MVKEIPLQNGMVALVDDEDFERVNKYQWHYAVSSGRTNITISNKKIGVLGRFLLEEDDENIVISFKDKNVLNHQKENLLKVKRATGNVRGRGHRNSTSKYKGVSFDKQTSRWVAQIQYKGKTKKIGRFDTEEEAALAYNSYATETFGKLAFLNVIGESNNATEVKISKTKVYRSKNKNGYRGIVYDAKNKYRFVIRIDGKHQAFGNYKTPEQAAKAYDQKAYELYGDKAILNFPKLIEEYKQALQGGATG